MKDRITLLIKAKNLTAAQFADEIGVQKSSISHIISGRNNASLDLIQKVLLTYPEVNIEWLMFGKGPLFKRTETATNDNNDEGLMAVPPVDLAPVDLFSELMPTKNADFRKENNLNTESEPEGNTSLEGKENDEAASVQKVKMGSVEFPIRNIENTTVISGHKETGTKTILKIVEFYSDNTYREFFPE